jgi:general secretion pathway protein G
MKRRNQRGFTLIEIMVVVVIISMLAAFVAPKVWKQLSKSKRNIARSRMAIIENALGQFRLDCGRLPNDSEGLSALLVDPEEFEEDIWDGPYLKKSDLIDPWKNPYEYREEGEVNIGSYDLISFGKDGEPEGEDEDEDIYVE